jgi:excisionase family DNA binding protein
MPTAPDFPRLLTTREVAEHLRLSVDQVRRLVRRGVLPAVRLTDLGSLRFLPGDLEAALEARVCGCGASREAVEPAADHEEPAVLLTSTAGSSTLPREAA